MKHTQEPRASKGRIAVVTMGVKLGNETRGYTRFRFISELLCQAGWEVDLITTSFQHWDKSHRITSDPSYHSAPYNVVFIDEPGYTKNLDLRRIYSHHVAALRLRSYFKHEAPGYDLIYAEIPPNDIARVCAECAHDAHIPFIADINDLWPEAMRMVVNIPVISDIAFHPFARDAKKTYQLMTAAVGTSQEYANRPLLDRSQDYPRITVYVGNELSVFDEGVDRYLPHITKDPEALWVSYAGTLGASYDLETLIVAGSLLKNSLPNLRIRILGDGPERSRLEDLADELSAPVDFLGYMPYERMAAELAASDIVVNSLVCNAAQSIVTKIGDYLASRSALINTGSSPEFRCKVKQEGFGVNVIAEDPEALARVIRDLALDPAQRAEMAAKGRLVAETQFNQPYSYQRIVRFIEDCIADFATEDDVENEQAEG